jgi:SRSO17 transposase
VAGLKDYCSGLMLPLSRKSVEPMAARIDPLHASARHQALHHFVAKAQWSDGELLRRVAQWVVPHMDFSRGGYWLVDDTGFPKKGKHSVGVARQWCGMLGKQDNCQVAVSVSLACEQASLPVKWQLYLPESWTTWGRLARFLTGSSAGPGSRSRGAVRRCAVGDRDEVPGIGITGIGRIGCR